MTNEDDSPEVAPDSSPKKPRKGRRGFGTLGKQKAKKGHRYYPSYVGPDARRYYCPRSFSTQTDTEAWLTAQRAHIDANTWTRNTYRIVSGRDAAITTKQTFREYAEKFIETGTSRRGTLLASNTRADYRRALALCEPFFDIPLQFIDKPMVDQWWADLLSDEDRKGKLTASSHAYTFLSVLFKHAVRRGVVLATPVDIPGAAKLRTGRKVRVPSDDEVERLFQKMDPRIRATVLVEAYTLLRFGEMRALRRPDLNIELDDLGRTRVELNVTRSIAYTPEKGYEEKDPKSAAGKRIVVMPPHATEAFLLHLEENVGDAKNALLFPSFTDPTRPIAYATYHRQWSKAVKAAGIEWTTPHALRHFGGTRLALAGATVKESMVIMGHAGPAAAMIYQDMVDDRRADLADRMSSTITGRAEQDRDRAAAKLARAQRERQAEMDRIQAEIAQEEAEMAARMAARKRQLADLAAGVTTTGTDDEILPDNVTPIGRTA